MDNFLTTLSGHSSCRKARIVGVLTFVLILMNSKQVMSALASRGQLGMSAAAPSRTAA